MKNIRIYVDESADVAIASGLRRHGIDAFSARDLNKLGLSDEEQLELARKEEAVIFTQDTDFLRLAVNKEHFGIIFSQKGKLSVGEIIRKIEFLASLLSKEGMKNHVEFI